MLRFRFSLSVVVAVCALFGVAACSRAQSTNGAVEPTATPDNNPIKMTLDSPLAYTSKPFAITTRFGRWFPLAVTLSNSGDAVSGTLRLQLVTSSNGGGAPDKPVSEFSAQVSLPANQSNKRVWMYGRVEREECDGAIVEYSGPGITTRRLRFDLSAIEPTTRCVVTISDSDEHLSFLSGLRDAQLGLPDAGEQTATNRFQANPTFVRALGARHEMVPSRWIGFDGADCVVLHDFPHTALSPSQLDALRGYVASGGTLVALGGANWQRLASSPLNALWPMQPNASNVASEGQVESLVNRYVTRSPLRGEDKLGGASVLLLRGALNPHARVFDGTPDAPMLTARDFGAGRVLMMSYDPTLPPFSGWSGQQELWKDAFGLSPRAVRVQGVVGGVDASGGPPGYYNGYNENQSDGGPTTQLLSDLSRTPQLKTPPVSSIAWFLALYVFFLVPLNYIVLRAMDKREWAWVTVPVIVAAFSTFAYSTALSIKGRDLISRRVEIVRTSNNADLARADSVLWLFSPRKTAYNLTGTDAHLVVAPRVQPSDAQGSNVSILEPDESKPLSVSGAAVNMWDNRAFIGASTLDLKKGVGISKLNGKIAVRNGSALALRGAVLVSGGQVFALGDIPAGGSKTTDKNDGANLSDARLVGRIGNAAKLSELFPSTGSEDPSAIANSALLLALGQDFGAHPIEGSLLVAWGDQPVTTMQIEGESARERNIALFLVRAPDVAVSGANAREAAVSAPTIDDANPNKAGNGPPGSAATPPRHTWEARFPSNELPTGALRITATGKRGGYYNGSYSNNGNQKGIAPTFSLWNWKTRAWQKLPTSGYKEVVSNSPNSSGYVSGYPTQSWKFSSVASNTRLFVRAPDGLLRVRSQSHDASTREVSLRVRAE